MFFKYDAKNGIKVPEPFNRVITPIMTTDTASDPIDFSIHMTEWAPGAKVDNHMHQDSTEAMFCLSGHGKASINDEEFDFEPMTMICALPGDMHQIINTGDELLKVLCIFSPAVSGEDLSNRARNAVEAYKKEHPEEG